MATDEKHTMLDWIDSNKEKFTDISDKIWEYAEPRFEEVKSAQLLIKTLEEEGFTVQKGVADMPTAFVGSFGDSGPVIAILGEYDALSNLSQVSHSLEKKPIEEGKAGHGCGHNILGAGSLAAAIAVKNYLHHEGIPGTIRYYGCPAEEGGSGKTFMVREGLFHDVDIAFCWHPMNMNFMFSVATLANIQAYFKFTGRSSHAAASPHLGRSALDAVELMNVGANYLREHIISEARVHYAITNTGGNAPNVVQPNAEVLYLIRAPTILQASDIYKRVQKIAQGAAMMTETEVEIVFDKAASNIIPNNVVGNILYKNLQRVGGPKFSDEEKKFGLELRKTIHDLGAEFAIFKKFLKNIPPEMIKKMKETVFFENIFPYINSSNIAPGSSDVGDVSWVVPTNQIGTTCAVSGTPGHSWQQVTQGAMTPAHKGLIVAAKVMALSAIEFILDKDLIIQAKDELEKKLAGNSYKSPIPSDIMPNIPDWVKKAMEE